MEKTCYHCKNSELCFVFHELVHLFDRVRILHSILTIMECITKHCTKFTPYEEK